MIKNLIRLAYLKPELRQEILGRTASSRVGRVEYDLGSIKEHIFDRIQSAVEASTKEPWLEVWDNDPKLDVGVDEDGNVYANIRVAITSFKRTPKLDVVERAVLRAVKKIPGGYVGSQYPKDDPDHGIELVILTTRCTSPSKSPRSSQVSRPRRTPRPSAPTAGVSSARHRR